MSRNIKFYPKRYEKFYEELRKIRFDKNESSAYVAKKTGLSDGTIARCEDKDAYSSPSLLTLSVLLDHYGVPLSEFFKRVEDNANV